MDRYEVTDEENQKIIYLWVLGGTPKSWEHGHISCSEEKRKQTLNWQIIKVSQA